MILHNDELFVTVGNTIFRAKRTSTRQFVFDPDALQGFFDGVNVKRNETTRPNQWGDFREPGLLGPRHLSLTGTAVASSPAELLSMRDEFTSLLAHGEYSEIAVQNSTETRYITVALEGSPSWSQKIDTAAVWKLDLYAPDPRMYGPTLSTQITDSTVNGGMDYPMDYPVNYGGAISVQAVSISNRGNTYSWPIFKVTGDFFQGFSVTNAAGKVITYDGVVTMTAPVTIDTGAGTATQNGTDKSTGLSSRDWFSIPPNQSIQPMFLPKQDAVGWCDIMYRDTWI
jgi:hypothetical protein